MNRRTPREPKKSDTLQIRIPYETKQEFLDACQADGTSASDVLRGSILDYLSHHKRPASIPRKGMLVMIPQPLRKKRYLAAGVAATVGFGLLAALPSAAANPDLHIAFQRLDGNSDGKLELAEFTSTPFPDTAYFREARMNGALGMPRDIVWVWPGVRQSAVQPKAQATAEAGRNEDGEGFRRFDANNDRVVSYEEFQAALSGMMFAFFEAMDRDKDGNISRGELDGGVEISARSVLARSGPLMNGGEVLDSFAAYDRNGDGVVTFEEYVPQP